MASVTIDSGELPSARGKRGHDLERVMTRWRQIADGRFEDDCRFLLQMIDETDELELWKHAANGFYKTRDEFLEKCVLIDFDFAEHHLSEIVTRLRKGERFGLQPLGKRGRPIKDSNTTISSDDRGATYALRRLLRDRPDLAARVQAGELSANAAAIEAGFRHKPTALQQLEKWWTKASPEEQAAFREWVRS